MPVAVLGKLGELAGSYKQRSVTILIEEGVARVETSKVSHAAISILERPPEISSIPVDASALDLLATLSVLRTDQNVVNAGLKERGERALEKKTAAIESASEALREFGVERVEILELVDYHISNAARAIRRSLMVESNSREDSECKVESTDADVALEEPAEETEYDAGSSEGNYEPPSWFIEEQQYEAEEELVAIIKIGEVDKNEPKFAHDVENCDLCGSSLLGNAVFVDGLRQGGLEWANMCAQCFSVEGVGVGWGSGQLYARQPNGDWRLVAGFNASEETS